MTDGLREYGERRSRKKGKYTSTYRTEKKWMRVLCEDADAGKPGSWCDRMMRRPLGTVSDPYASSQPSSTPHHSQEKSGDDEDRQAVEEASIGRRSFPMLPLEGCTISGFPIETRWPCRSEGKAITSANCECFASLITSKSLWPVRPAISRLGRVGSCGAAQCRVVTEAQTSQSSRNYEEGARLTIWLNPRSSPSSLSPSHQSPTLLRLT